MLLWGQLCVLVLVKIRWSNYIVIFYLKKKIWRKKFTLAGQMANSFHARLMIYLSLGKTKRMIKVQSRKLLPGEKVPLSKLKASVYEHIIWSCRYDQKWKFGRKSYFCYWKVLLFVPRKSHPFPCWKQHLDKIFGLLNKTKKLIVTKIWLLSQPRIAPWLKKRPPFSMLKAAV